MLFATTSAIFRRQEGSAVAGIGSHFRLPSSPVSSFIQWMIEPMPRRPVPFPFAENEPQCCRQSCSPAYLELLLLHSCQISKTRSPVQMAWRAMPTSIHEP